MNRAIGLGLLAVGIVLVILGFNASDSLQSELSEFFSGTPTNEAIWMLIGGILLGVVGAAVMLRTSPRSA